MRRVLLGLFVLCALPSSAPAQSSVGFADPRDLDALLAYRLPDWGYRTIGATFDLDGHGSHGEGSNLSTHTSESLDLVWSRESERQAWRLTGAQSGAWSWSQSEWNSRKRTSHGLDGGLSLGAAVNRYVSDSFAVVVSARAAGSYHEGDTVIIDFSSPARKATGQLQAGVAWGRIRDVTPLLQAQRVRERLIAMGRPPLSGDAVLRLASLFARQSGYAQVFDRPDRRFWQDCFGPLVADGQPLTPFEVLSLKEVMVERLGTRRQGWRGDFGAEAGTSMASDRHGTASATPVMNFVWSRNTDLNHQISLSATARYAWRSLALDDGGQGGISCEFEHLWIVADRVVWDTTVGGILNYAEYSNLNIISRFGSAAFRSNCDIYVEDRVRLSTGLGLNWSRNELAGVAPRREQWDWGLSFGLKYDLERTLF